MIIPETPMVPMLVDEKEAMVVATILFTQNEEEDPFMYYLTAIYTNKDFRKILNFTKPSFLIADSIKSLLSCDFSTISIRKTTDDDHNKSDINIDYLGSSPDSAETHYYSVDAVIINNSCRETLHYNLPTSEVISLVCGLVSLGVTDIFVRKTSGRLDKEIRENNQSNILFMQR